MDASATELLNLSWKQVEIDSWLTFLRRYVEHEAQRHIDWYFRKAKAKALVSAPLAAIALLSWVAWRRS
jgi:hypothetical protein